MSKSKRECIFGPGHGKLSKAHIIPAWLGDLITDKADHHLERVGYFETFSPKVLTPARWERKRLGDSGSRKVRKVCTTCNSGWMSSLETPAKDIVIALMQGDPILLDVDAQTKLASWIALIALLYDVVEQASTAIPMADRLHLKSTLRPPPTWKIWITKYGGENWQDHRCRRQGMKISPAPEEVTNSIECNTQVTTLVIRHLCAHVFSSTVMDDLGGYDGIPLHQIWPPARETIVWNSVAAIDDAHVIALSEALAASLDARN